jgi:hypothetical protein
LRGHHAPEEIRHAAIRAVIFLVGRCALRSVDSPAMCAHLRLRISGEREAESRRGRFR